MILEAADGEFLTRGYAATSMNRVAASAGVSKATIYAYFNGKDELFSRVIGLRLERRQVFTAPLDMDDARSALSALGHRILEALLSSEAIATYRMVLDESTRHPELAQAFYSSGPSEGLAYVSAVISELAARGKIHVRDPCVAADQFMGLLRSEFLSRTLLGLPFREGRSPPELVDRSVDFILRAYACSWERTLR